MQTNKLSNQKISFNETKKITDRLTIKAKVKSYFIRDTELSGFWIRVPANNPEGATYLVNTKPQGARKDIRRSIGKVSLYKAKEAREIARGWIQQIKQGTDPKEETRKTFAQSQKLSEAFEQYISERESAGKLGETSIRNYRYDMQGRLVPLMSKEVNRLNEQVIIDWYKRGRAEAPTQTDRAYRELNAVLNYLVALNVIEYNPANAVKTQGHRTTVKPKQTFLNTEECGKLIAKLVTFRKDNPHLIKQTNLLLMGLFTGLREKNLYSLKWEQVTLRDSVFIEQTKNGDTYHLPLIPLLNDLLEQQREITPKSCPWVFPNKNFDGPIVDMRKAINRLYKEAGIDATFADHDLRRTFASLADMAGVSHTDIKHLMVHKKRDITEKYMQSQQVKAKENYRRILEFIASISPIGTGNEDNREITHYLTPDLMRLALFDKGPLSKHPERYEPDFFIVNSDAYYKEDITEEWE